MNVRELVAQLLDISENEVNELAPREYGDPAVLDREVRLAQQPNWPFEFSVGEVAEVETHGDDIAEISDAMDDMDMESSEYAEALKELERLKGENKHLVYIGEGSHLGYLSGSAATALGWR